MTNDRKFFICSHCGNIAKLTYNAGVPLVCCGEKMSELLPNTKEASTEKHIPVITVDGNKVTVDIGSVAHPMTPEHFITGVQLFTKKGSQVKTLTPNDAPKLEFILTDDDTVEAAYAYCNLHGLWSAEA